MNMFYYRPKTSTIRHKRQTRRNCKLHRAGNNPSTSTCSSNGTTLTNRTRSYRPPTRYKPLPTTETTTKVTKMITRNLFEKRITASIETQSCKSLKTTTAQTMIIPRKFRTTWKSPRICLLKFPLMTFMISTILVRPPILILIEVPLNLELKLRDLTRGMNGTTILL